MVGNFGGYVCSLLPYFVTFLLSFIQAAFEIEYYFSRLTFGGDE